MIPGATNDKAVLEHLESNLGPMAYGWTRSADGVPMPFDVVRFDAGPSPGTTTFATVGLSNHLLLSPNTGQEIWQEFLFISLAAQADTNIPAILQQVGAQVIRRRRALLRGEVIGPHGPLFPGRPLTALYAAIPICFPDAMHSLALDAGREVVLVWLVPLYKSEAKMVSNQGWPAFEKLLASRDPDLSDLARASVVDEIGDLGLNDNSVLRIPGNRL